MSFQIVPCFVAACLSVLVLSSVSRADDPNRADPNKEEPVGGLAAPQFLRGDANGDDRVSFADVFAILRYLHQGGALTCLDAADVDDSGFVSSNDFVYLLGSQFLGQAPPPAPHPAPGVDPTEDSIGCSLSFALGADPEADFPEEPAEVPADACFPANGGADTEYILFLFRDVYAYPGQEGLRVPLVMSNRAGVEGLTIGLVAANSGVRKPDGEPAVPADLRLEAIDFSGAAIDAARGRQSWQYSYDDRVSEGYLASIFAVDLSEDLESLNSLANEVIAHVEISVSPDAVVGQEWTIDFEDVPGEGSRPSIPNEIVRQGRRIRGQYCGTRVHIVPQDRVFLRGDANRNWDLEITDAIQILLYLFDERVVDLPCLDAADVDDSGLIALSDAIRVLNHLFLGHTAPWPGIPTVDQSDALGCAGI